MTDVTTAATIASLRAEVERLKAELQGEREDLAACYKAKAALIDERDACLRELDFARAELHRRVCELGVKGNALDERNVYAERLLAENVQLTNRQTMDREEIESMGKRNDSLTQSIITACTGSGCLNAHELRVALDTARERAGVLERECRKWRHNDDVHECEPMTEYQMRRSIDAHDDACRAAQETDRTHALDAAKFGGA